jgi:hypothetical protein
MLSASRTADRGIPEGVAEAQRLIREAITQTPAQARGPQARHAARARAADGQTTLVWVGMLALCNPTQEVRPYAIVRIPTHTPVLSLRSSEPTTRTSGVGAMLWAVGRLSTVWVTGMREAVYEGDKPPVRLLASRQFRRRRATRSELVRVRVPGVQSKGYVLPCSKPQVLPLTDSQRERWQ